MILAYGWVKPMIVMLWDGKEEGIGGGVLQGSYIICEVVEYYLRVNYDYV